MQMGILPFEFHSRISKEKSDSRECLLPVGTSTQSPNEIAKSPVITGCNSGIGHEFAKILVREVRLVIGQARDLALKQENDDIDKPRGT
jgi:short-subunit dehydrogenase